MVKAGRDRLGVQSGDERLAVLPMSDQAERVLGLYVALDAGIVSNYLESSETGRENLQEVKPTLFGADAEAWTRLHARITAAADAATAITATASRAANPPASYPSTPPVALQSAAPIRAGHFLAEPSLAPLPPPPPGRSGR
jgi:long-subunit acyl-CoA synthetase (AMP-forming)